MDIHEELNHIRRLAGLQEQARQPIPTVKFKEVYHVGDLQSSSKKLGSHEGAGLSFSFHPEEWSRIARLGGQLWTLTKPSGGTFINVHKMTKKQLSSLINWGVESRYVIPVITYTVSYYDDEWEDTMTMQFDDREKAEEEAEGYETEVVENLEGLKPTATMIKRIGYESPLNLVVDHLTTIYAEDHGLDGVWWDDYLDVSKLSAPRGVIVPSMVNTWNPKLVRNL